MHFILLGKFHVYHKQCNAALDEGQRESTRHDRRGRRRGFLLRAEKFYMSILRRDTLRHGKLRRYK